MKADMLVKLYDLPDVVPGIDELKNRGFQLNALMLLINIGLFSMLKKLFLRGGQVNVICRSQTIRYLAT